MSGRSSQKMRLLFLSPLVVRISQRKVSEIGFGLANNECASCPYKVEKESHVPIYRESTSMTSTYLLSCMHISFITFRPR